jgi:hypothetical protein
MFLRPRTVTEYSFSFHAHNWFDTEFQRHGLGNQSVHTAESHYPQAGSGDGSQQQILKWQAEETSQIKNC